MRLKRRRPDRPGGGDTLASGFAVFALALLAGFVSLPFLGLVIWMVDKGSWRVITSPVALQALLLSAQTTAMSMAIILVVGTPAAYVLARMEFPGKRVINTVVDIPAVLPPVAAGIALLLAFGRLGLLGQYLRVLGIELSFTTVAVVIAQLFVATHFYVRQAAVGFGRIDRDVEEAAMVDGANRAMVFARITLPLALPALVAGAITAGARGLGEFGATIIFAGSFPGVTQTIPLAIYAALESDLDAAVALSVLILGFSFVVILVARLLTRKLAEY